jgi:hypothetical protein
MFKPGNPGRQPGTQNRVTTTLRQAILIAAAEVGENGKGRDGLVGYLKQIARRDIRTYAMLLARVLPLDVRAGSADGDTTYRTAAEVRAELERCGISRALLATLASDDEAAEPSSTIN